jgi:outer membrane receptor protein involved in Fe transport
MTLQTLARVGLALSVLTLLPSFFGQTAPSARTATGSTEVVELSPFVVQTDSESGYLAKETLAGMRIKTDLKEVGAAIDVLTEQFLNDVGATNMFEALQYVPNMEFNAYPSDNDANNNSQWFSASYKSRGINGSTVLLDFFSTSSVPIDRYNSDNLTLLRGANAILFGIGSPSGIVGASTKRAQMSRNGYTVRMTNDDNGSIRGELDVNYVLLKNRLALRLMAVAQDKHIDQEPSLNRRNAGTITVTYKPFTRTAITVTGERGIYDRLHVQNNIVWDGVTPWVLAGRPTVNFVTGKGMTNGSTTKGQFPTAVANGLQNIGTASLLTYIEGSNLPVMDWRNMARGARWGNSVPAAPAGVFNSGLINPTDRSALDFTGFTEANTIVKLNANPWGGMNTNDLMYHNRSIFLEQNLARDLDVELAWNTFYQDYNFYSFGMQNYVNVDPNEVLPDGSPNPYLGMPYIETGNGGNGTRRQLQWREFTNKRVTLSYRLNLDDKRPFARGPRWLRAIGFGDYRIAGLHADEEFDSQLVASRIVNVTPIPGSPAANPLNQNVNRLNRRYYLKPGESSYVYSGPDVFIQANTPGAPAANNGPLRFEERNSDEAPRNTRQATTSHVAAIQGAWFKSTSDGYPRLTGMYGLRRDHRESNAQTFIRQANGEYATRPNSYDGLEASGVWGQESSFSADTKSWNVTLRPISALRIFYNFSNIFSGGASNFVDVFGKDLRPTQGDTKDYGIKIDLFNERLFLTVTKYETTIFDQTNDNTGTVREPINQIYDALQRPDLFLDRPFSYRDDATKGYEYTLTAAPTKNWRVRATVGTQKTFVSANMDEWVTYHEQMLPVWSAGLNGQGRATPLVNQSAGYNNIGHAIDRAQQRLRDARAIIGTRPTAQRGINSSLNTTYSFSEGFLKGVRIGGGYRWASPNILGYARDNAGNSDSSRPFEGEEQISTDASIGYSRRIWNNRLNWDIQLNVYNVLNDKDPLPRTAVDDGRGNPIYVRNYLPEPITFQLTNTIRF